MRLRSHAAIALLCAVNTAGARAESVCRVTDHGAKADGRTLDTRALQAAVDACAAKGGGRVVVPGPATYLIGTVLLKSGITLDVEEGAVLLGSADYGDYRTLDPFVDGVGAQRGACLIGAEGARRVRITGKGTIDGQGQLWDKDHPERGRRPFLVRFVRCRDVAIGGVLLTRPAAWTCNLYQCRDVAVRGLRIVSEVNANNDGIDLDGCRKVRISGCRIQSGDDAICFKTTSLEPNEDIRVTDCDLQSKWGAFKWGTESLGDMRRFRISRCRVHDTAGGGIKILSADGARIEDIRISDITLDDVDMPLSILLRSRLRSYRDLPKRDVGTIRDVRIENVRGRASDDGRVKPAAAILIAGLPEHPVERIVLRDVRLSVPGGGALADADRAVPELAAEYPEYSRVGVLPAHGGFLRHVRDVRLRGVRIEARSPDLRPPFVCEDAAGLSLEGTPKLIRCTTGKAAREDR
jgi:hypothetical protein